MVFLSGLTFVSFVFFVVSVPGLIDWSANNARRPKLILSTTDRYWLWWLW